MEIDEWFDKVDDLQTYILDKEKECQEPIKIWTNGMDDSNKTEYESKVTDAKIVVVAKSKEVAAALFTLIRYKVDYWDQGRIVDDYVDEYGVVDEKSQGVQLTVENMFNVLVKHESHFLKNQDVSSVVVKKLIHCYCVDENNQPKSKSDMKTKKYIYKHHVNIKEERSKDSSYIHVEMEIHRPLSEVEIYTPTDACLDRLLEY